VRLFLGRRPQPAGSGRRGTGGPPLSERALGLTSPHTSLAWPWFSKILAARVSPAVCVPALRIGMESLPILLLLLPTATFGQPLSLALSSGAGAPGTTVSLSITLEADAGTQPAGLQWTLNYSSADFMAVQVVASSSATMAGKSISCAGQSGSLICLLVGLNADLIPNGVVAIATLQISATTTSASSSILLTNVVAATPDGRGIPISGSGGVVTITQSQQVPALSQFSCSPAVVTPPSASGCTVSLTSSAPSGGVTVGLSSSSPSVSVPGLVSVPPGASSVIFQATATAVSVTTTVQLTASFNRVSLSFVLTIGTPISTPLIYPAGVVNAASFLPGPVSPGEIVSIFGARMGPSVGVGLRLTSSGLLDNFVGGIRVLFDGISAPLVFVRADLVSAIVPYEVVGRTATQLQIEYQGTGSNVVSVPVTDTAPAIFALDGSGRGQGAILNQDGSTNSLSSPAQKGSIVVLFATGEGQTSPFGVDGKLATDPYPKPVHPVSVRIGGIDAEIIYAGAAPQEVAGVLQVNARVPNGVVSGNAVPIWLNVGNAVSQPGMTLAIQSP
jgi:uncharacterized protein (TIGR03437 family)